jgi:hypothetical protein
LSDGTGHGNRPHGHEIGQGEVETDTEHQQDDANLGELRREFLIRHIARREGADEYAGQQIAHERREPQPLRQGTKHERQSKTGHDGCDQRCVMRQGLLRGWRVGSLRLSG